MKRLFVVAIALAVAAPALLAAETETPPSLEEQVKELKKQLVEQKAESDAKIGAIQREMAAMKAEREKSAEEGRVELERTVRRLQTELQSDSRSSSWLPAGIQSLNPDISVIIDTFYHNDDSSDGIEEVFEHMAGFGHSHGGGEEHHHAGVEDGFNLRHLELHLSGEVDPYFRAWAIPAISEEGAELEEAVVQSSNLPCGLQLQAGKFFSGFGRINSQHSHQWDFVDQPLIYRLALGPHGLNEKGAQLSWLAPTPFYLLAGVEAFQGENEVMFGHVGGDELSRREGPRLGVGWIKVAPNLPGNHALQAGLFGACGVHEEAHDGNEDGESDHWLQGNSRFYGGDLVYKYDAPKPDGEGDVMLQGEYFHRKMDLEVKQHDLMPALEGHDKVNVQDGFYLQGIYGFRPKWRGGLRWDQVGLVNKQELPDGSHDNFGSSYRLAAMLDYSPTEFSRLRLQAGRGEYSLEDGRDGVWEVFLQLSISLGTHGAHKF
jgi:hypothetical protein